jgi:predicted metalloprotease with PDZ domain
LDLRAQEMRRNLISRILRRTAAIFVLCLAAPWTAQLSRAAQAPGETIRIEVDATRAPQKIIHSHLKIPVTPGPLALYYPKWIPGEHSPSGPVINVAGMKFTAGGKMLPWRRDLSDSFTFHLDVPQDVSLLDVDLDFLLSGPTSGSTTADASSTAFIDDLSWNQLLLYPQGHAVDDLTYAPTLRLPLGWKFGTALTVAKEANGVIEFAPVPLRTLIDSPVLSGRYFRVIQLTPGQKPAHELDIAADSAASLEMTPEMQLDYHQLVAETGALFGVRHYRNYHFLVTLSDDVAHFGLEHHESSDDREGEKSLIDDAGRIDFADLLPHEFVHSWNGKYRRPADLATPDYQQPMKDDLLWVYEGLTEYLGEVLTSRSGLLSPQQSHELWARDAAMMAQRPGRLWRSLQDTADSGTFLYDADLDWSSWRRDTDFYEEGALLWLDVDTTLRSLTQDHKSMNDFCLAFYGGPGGEPALKTYTFEDIVATLNSLAPYDWTEFLRSRLDAVPSNTPLEAIENSGWKLVYDEQPNQIEEAKDFLRKRVTLAYSVGLILEDDGTVDDVIYDGPSYKAGLGPGMKVTAVNGKQFSPDEMKEAITVAKGSTVPIQLIVANGAEVRTMNVDYHGGLQNPHIERRGGYPDRLGEILRPLAR